MEQKQVDHINANQVFRRLLGYWSGYNRLEKNAPGSDSFEPSKLGYLLPYIAVAEVDESGNRYRLLYVGETVVDRFGPGIKDKYLDEVDSEDVRVDIARHFRAVVETGQPDLSSDDMHESVDDPFSHYETLTLPLATNDNPAGVLVCAITYAAGGKR